MMGTLVCFELKKAVRSRFFLLVFCVAILVNFLTQCGIAEYQGYLYAMRSVGDEAPTHIETFFEYVGGERNVTRIMSEVSASIEFMSEEEHAEAVAALKEKYGETVLSDYTFLESDAIRQVPGVLANLSDYEYLTNIEMLEKINSSANQKISNVLKSAESFRQEAELEKDIYGVRKNESIEQLYSIPRQAITTYIRYGGDLFFESPAMLLVFLLLLLTASRSVAGEHDRRTWLLLHTAKYGKGKTLLAKYISGWLIGMVLTVILQVFSILAYYFKGGTLGFDQPVTAIEQLILCPYSIQVWQYFLLSICCQIFTAMLFSTILTSVSAFSRPSFISCGIGALLLGLFLLPVYFPPRTEWLAGPLVLSSPLRFFERYYDANIFGFSVPWVVVLALVWSIFAVAMAIVTTKVYHRKDRVV
ncbi:MAG: ABC transporter permease subunit [Acutalibacter sp.]|nr:ABC transporter permease subunit [Acutalibacter sp.]